MGRRRRGRCGAAIHAMGVAVLLLLSGCNISPEESAQRALQSMESYEPTFALVRRYEPRTHAELRGFIEQQIREPSGGRDGFERGIRDVMARMVIRRLRSAPDHLVVDYLRLVADETQRLEAHPDVCAAILLGTAGDIRAYESATAVERERRFYRALLTAPPAVRDLPMATEPELERFREAFLNETQTVMSLPQEQALDALDGIGLPLDVCRVTGAFMRNLGRLPATEAGRLFRLIALLMEQGEQNVVPTPFV